MRYPFNNGGSFPVKSTSEIEYSVVVPVYNSAGTLMELTGKLRDFFVALDQSFEIIYVDDGSTDHSWEILKQLKKDFSFIKIFRLKENRGQLNATTCGIDSSLGKKILTTDCDLQYDPRDFSNLIKCFETGKYRIVFGVADQRKADRYHLFRVMVANFLFNQFILRAYRRIIYFSGFRIFGRELFFNDRNERKSFNLFYVWDIPPEEIGNAEVIHYTDPRGRSSYNLIKRIKHFRCYLEYGAAYVFARFAFLFAFLAFILFYEMWLGRLAKGWFIGISVCFFTAIILHFYFKQRLSTGKKVDYVIAESFE